MAIMQLLKSRSVAVIAVLLAVSASLRADNATNVTRQKVDKTFDNRPFEYEIRPLRKTAAYSVYRLTYPSPLVTEHEANNTIPADYYLPSGIEADVRPRPAVVCLHILNGNFELVNMLCSALAERGIPAVMFKLPYYGERELPGGRKELLENPRLFISALEQGGADVRRTVDLLASRPEVDAEKIGVAGISLGGLLAATSAADEPRLGRAALILAGGDLLSVVQQAGEARRIREYLEKLPADKRVQFERVVRSADPLSHAAGLRLRAEQGRVLMINATEDRVVPKRCAEKLAAALGMSDRVVWLEGLGHYTAMAALPRVMRTTVDFFAVDLPEGVKPSDVRPPDAEVGPKRLLILLLQDAAALSNNEPQPGRCHLADVEITVKPKDGKKNNQPVAARLRFVRGWAGRFRLGLKINRPKDIEFELGQDDCPWVAASGKAVFRGSITSPADTGTTKNGQCENPLALADEQHLLKLQMAGGLLSGVSLSPSLLDNLASFSEETGDGETRVLRISRKDAKRSDSISLRTQKNSTTPDVLTFSVKGVEGAVKFHAWQIDTVGHEALFAPPSDLPVREVPRDDVYRIFSSLFNFAMEMAQ